ncbi:hypothetical protein ABZ851_30560, partial [Streptomyces sp. NPDC047049]|uniref:hypothetical protein n=1 Tax=Streptomyces sp. NPDC047049 TaxID=3156688 RepID=UPI0033DB11B7
KPDADAKPDTKPDADAKPDTDAKPDADAKPDTKPDADAKPDTDAKPDADAKPDTKPDADAKPGGTATSGAGRKPRASQGKRSTQASTPPEYGPAQRKVWDSFLDSRVHSRKWDSHGVNLIPELWRLLKVRIQADRKSTGRTELTQGHYLDAVLLNAPLDQDKLVQLADQFQVELEGAPKGKKSTLSLSPQAISNFDTILELLDAADYNRKGKDAICWLVLQLLRDLQEEGPLPKTEPKTLL